MDRPIKRSVELRRTRLRNFFDSKYLPRPSREIKKKVFFTTLFFYSHGNIARVPLHFVVMMLLESINQQSQIHSYALDLTDL